MVIDIYYKQKAASNGRLITWLVRTISRIANSVKKKQAADLLRSAMKYRITIKMVG